MSEATPEVHVYREIAGKRLELELIRPPQQSGAPHPALVLFHGGGWRMGAREQLLPQCRWLAARGVAGITASYRLATEGSGCSPADCTDDAVHALRWVRSNAFALGLDAERIAAGGGSAGGQMAVAAATQVRVAALVLFNPALAPDGTPRLLFLGDRCPAWAIGPGHPPALVLHGTADTIVPIDHSRRYRDVLKSLDLRCDLVEYEGMPHAFFNFAYPKGRLEETLEETGRFLESLGLLSPAGA